jgi:hypothetical protein
MATSTPIISPVIIKTDTNDCHERRGYDYGHGYGHHGHHDRDRCDHEGEFHILESVADNARDILLSNGTNVVSTLNAVSEAAKSGIITGSSNTQSILASDERLLESVNKGALLTLRAIDENGSKCRELAKDAIIEQLKQSCDLKHIVADGFGSTKLQVLQAENSVIRRSDEHFSTLRHELCDKVHELSKDAFKHKAELSAELSRDFCCLKDKVEARGDKTDDLIRCLEDKKLREKVDALEKENLLLKIKCCPGASVTSGC